MWSRFRLDRTVSRVLKRVGVRNDRKMGKRYVYEHEIRANGDIQSCYVPFDAGLPLSCDLCGSGVVPAPFLICPFTFCSCLLGLFLGTC